MERLPAYAPELNPIEGVWSHLKRIELRNLCCQSLVELKGELPGGSPAAVQEADYSGLLQRDWLVLASHTELSNHKAGKNMKILQINNFQYVRGGSDRVYFETGKLLKDYGHEVTYFAASSGQNEDDALDATVVPESLFFELNKFEKIAAVGKFIYSKFNAKALGLALKKTKPDVAHLHIFYGQLTSSILPVLKRHGIPIVMSLHEYRLLCPAYTFINGRGNICKKCALRGHYYNAIFNRCTKGNIIYSAVAALECYMRDGFWPHDKLIDQFIMVSEFSKKIHLKYKPQMEVKSQRIYNFVRTENIEPNYFHQNYFLYFGRLSHEKGVLTFIKAACLLPNLKFRIVGTGPMESELTEFVRISGAKNVEFMGYKAGEELATLIREAMYVVVPSEWYENNPMTIVEAFGFGTPVIGANIGGIPELICPGKNGFLFESRNSGDLARIMLSATLLSSDEWCALAKNARIFAEENFSAKSHYQKLINVYDKAIRG